MHQFSEVIFIWRVGFVSLLIGGLTLALYYWLKDMDMILMKPGL
jgi:hypothetical protein